MNVLRDSASCMHAIRLMRPSQMKDRSPSVLEKPSEHGKQRPIGEIIVISCNKHILAAALSDSHVNICFRTDIHFVAMVTQIPVRLLHLFDKIFRIICRCIVRNKDFRQIIVSQLS